MRVKTLSLLIFVMALSCLFCTSCGGGGGGYGTGFTAGMPDGNIATVPTPTYTPTQTQSLDLASKGYVYVGSGRATSPQMIVLQTNTNPPTGFSPAPGYIVRSTANPSLVTRTDSLGFFDLSSAFFTVDPSSAFSIIIEDPDSLVPPISYPVIGSPLPLSLLTDVKVVPPFNDNGQDRQWTLFAGQCEMFYLVGKSGNVWHTVSDAITWSISDSSMGTFLGDMGIFVASDSLSATATGTITAQCQGSSYALSLKVVKMADIGTIEGYVKDESGNPVANCMVEAYTIQQIAASQGRPSVPGSAEIPYSMGITDGTGHYKIYDLPFDTYTVKVMDLYGTDLATATVQVNGPVTRDFTVTASSTSTSLYAIVRTDNFAYKPGDTIKAQVSILNIGSSAANLQYSSIEFKLVNTDLFYGTTTVITSATAQSGSVQVASYGQALAPTQAVSLTIPQNIDVLGNYSVEAVVSSTPSLTVDGCVVMIGTTTPLPTPTGSPLPTPTPQPTSTTTPPSTNDYYILGEIKSRLNDAYYSINDYANRAYYGEDVSYYVNESSTLQYRLKYVRNDLMPSLRTVNYWSWQSQIDSMLTDLNRYAYYSGTYSDLYSAARTDNYLINSVDSAQWAMRMKYLKKGTKGAKTRK
jgi:hypothetical protein